MVRSLSARRDARSRSGGRTIHLCDLRRFWSDWRERERDGEGVLTAQTSRPLVSRLGSGQLTVSSDDLGLLSSVSANGDVQVGGRSLRRIQVLHVIYE